MSAVLSPLSLYVPLFSSLFTKLGCRDNTEADSVPNKLIPILYFFTCHFQLCVNDMSKQNKYQVQNNYLS